MNLLTLLLMGLSLHSLVTAPNTTWMDFSQPAISKTPKIEVVYDRSKDRTTVRLTPVQISRDKDKYHSVHMAPAFSYQGQEARTPEIIDFELRTVVKGKLKIDLYVLFIVDGEKIFLSSNRWGEKKGKLGRGWMGEHLVFRMPYETFLRITRASSFAIKLDGISFPVGEEQLQALREFGQKYQGSPNQ